MSKIGKKPIPIPKGVEVKINGNSVSVKGPKGELKKHFDDSILISLDNDQAVLSLKDQNAGSQKAPLWGLTRALMANMIKGVTNGFEKNLEFEGVGYKVNIKGSDLELNLGYSHPILIKIPAGITIKVEKNIIKVGGVDNELIGHVAAEIKSKRPPEPYKGKGIKYAGEVIRRKAGKKAATAA
ncbi:MAG: 50S ribosomal protein L6 [Candidatus Taylorbacteria bacterium]|nr:50S ribosomal protein L6 [Candidatus Taylorbacteria bacterium]